MGARPDLDLSGILGSYTDVLPTPETVDALRKAERQDSALCYERPARLGWGPDRWSTSMALVPVERVCHDVNGYYRELGVDWRATKKELREAYQALDGQSSTRLTYVFKQLLDPVTREAYDRAQKGEVFLDDYTEEDLKRRAHREAAERSQRLGQTVTSDEVLDEWGYVDLDEEEVDSVKAVRQDRTRRRAEQWNYSYYAWRTKSFVQDEARLQEWQLLLSAEASRQGSHPEMGIGVTSVSDQPYMMDYVHGRPVLFFSTETEPDQGIASQAFAEFLNSLSS
jgi:hypothetical protein